MDHERTRRLEPQRWFAALTPVVRRDPLEADLLGHHVPEGGAESPKLVELIRFERCIVEKTLQRLEVGDGMIERWSGIAARHERLNRRHLLAKESPLGAVQRGGRSLRHERSVDDFVPFFGFATAMLRRRGSPASQRAL